MVNDYISREAAIDKLIHLERTSYHNSVLWPDHVEECREALCDVPAADVRPVVRGKWIVDSIATNIFHCSVCGNDASVEPTGGTEYKSNFCPNCGADMRKVVEIKQFKESAE